MPNNQLLQCMNKKTIILFFLFLFSFLSSTYAQTLSGKITDAETNQPLEAVMISVLRGNGTMIDYALTDARRTIFPAMEIQRQRCKSAYHCWAIDGKCATYRCSRNTPYLSLHPEAIALKEVQIRPGRIQWQERYRKV